MHLQPSRLSSRCSTGLRDIRLKPQRLAGNSRANSIQRTHMDCGVGSGGEFGPPLFERGHVRTCLEMGDRMDIKMLRLPVAIVGFHYGIISSGTGSLAIKSSAIRPVSPCPVWRVQAPCSCVPCRVLRSCLPSWVFSSSLASSALSHPHTMAVTKIRRSFTRGGLRSLLRSLPTLHPSPTSRQPDRLSGMPLPK